MICGRQLGTICCVGTSNLFEERWPGRQLAVLAAVERAIDGTVCHCAVDRITSECTQKILKTLQKHERFSRGEVKWGLNGGSPPRTWSGHGQGNCHPTGARTAPEDQLCPL